MAAQVGRSTTANSKNPRTLTIVVVVGILTLLLAQQVATGWIALGERVNISRRDYNLIEIVVIAGGVLWGIFALWTALRLRQDSEEAAINEYFDGERPMPARLRFTNTSLAIIGAICLLIALQILTGWIPLGDRINISRRDLNTLEWGAIALAVFWATMCLRTVLGFVRRERPAWSWGQWILFISAAGGITVLLSGLFDIRDFAQRQGPASFPDILRLLLPGFIVILGCLAAYRLVVVGYSDVRTQKAISGTLGERAKARDVSRARTPAGQTVRNQLAKSPSAGAIIGFIAVFTLFSISTDLFLQSQSLASALTNNITRGIVAIGTTILMISGEFDLSVGSLLGIGGLSFMGLITGAFPPGIGAQHPIVAAVVSVAIVCFFGFLNGVILVRTGIPSFIVTLSTLLMLRAIPLVFIAGGKTLRYVDYFQVQPNIEISRILALVLAVVLGIVLLFIARSLLPPMLARLRERLNNYASDENDFKGVFLLLSTIYLVAVTIMFVAILWLVVGSILDQITQLGQGNQYIVVSLFDLLNGRIASLPLLGEVPINVNLRIGVFWWFLLVIIFNFVLEQTRYGNACFAVGGNAGAARAQGINVSRVKIMNYTLLAFLVGIAALFNAARLQSIDALSGQGLELEVIAATVIGGTLLAGGYGSIVGALLGVFIFGMMQTGLVQNNIDARLFDGVIGVIILVSVIINTWSRRIRS